MLAPQLRHSLPSINAFVPFLLTFRHYSQKSRADTCRDCKTGYFVFLRNITPGLSRAALDIHIDPLIEVLDGLAWLVHGTRPAIIAIYSCVLVRIALIFPKRYPCVVARRQRSRWLCITLLYKGPLPFCHASGSVSRRPLRFVVGMRYMEFRIVVCNTVGFLFAIDVAPLLGL